LLYVGKLLIPVNQHGVLIHAGLNRHNGFRHQWLATIDTRNFACEGVGDGVDGDSHEQSLFGTDNA
jgi:hypothetical protein